MRNETLFAVQRYWRILSHDAFIGDETVPPYAIVSHTWERISMMPSLINRQTVWERTGLAMRRLGSA
ncbi:hypothetical protein DM02DRAFT_545894 [Periconia macrospinosa]|uniref:Uncharacterized protein n=1 Tax=Periconia macrospinosa TaxID=97972 RepID=A0A2V1D020_9PLEO|nr:hypothetical protein DM02DRAFT_545894 [Periconia macrospinosa]